MVVLQLKAKYAGARLGILWAVITPIVLAIAINFVFTIVFKVVVQNYTLFVLAGIIPWIFFSSSSMEATNSFINNSSILKQGIFPREIIPIASVISNLLNFFIGFIFLLPVFIIANIQIIGLLPYLVLVVVLQFIFILGLGLLFSCTNVFIRDLNYLLPFAFMIWFWITPIFYSLEMIDFPYRWICLINPMTYFVISYQSILFDAKVPSASTQLIAVLFSIVSLLTGYLFFLKKEALLLKRV